ncbi:MAG: 3'-5' exonuclease [Nanoarchaeota archaeon]|nr:3'-5' exonuclease [Nanoarchaeota archaeon]
MKRLVIDTETTGLSPYFNKTLTVGMLLIDIEKDFLNILDQSHTFIKHDIYNHTSGASRTHKINMKVHEKISVHPKIACQQINSFILKNEIQETTILGHNIGFDKGFLNALFDQGESLALFHHQSVDTLQIWRHLQKENLVPEKINGKLGSIAEFFDINYTKAHDALEDTKITAKVYHEMLKLR